MSTVLRILVGDTSLTVDWTALRKQKDKLVTARFWNEAVDDGAADGLIEFLDAFQDAAAKVLGDKNVFGR